MRIDFTSTAGAVAAVSGIAGLFPVQHTAALPVIRGEASPAGTLAPRSSPLPADDRNASLHDAMLAVGPALERMPGSDVQAHAARGRSVATDARYAHRLAYFAYRPSSEADEAADAIDAIDAQLFETDGNASLSADGDTVVAHSARQSRQRRDATPAVNGDMTDRDVAQDAGNCGPGSLSVDCETAAGLTQRPAVRAVQRCHVPTATVSEMWTTVGLEGTASDLACMRETAPERYEYFRVIRENAARVVRAASERLKQLSWKARTGQPLCDTVECFAALGLPDSKEMRGKLREGLRQMEACLVRNKPPLKVAMGSVNDNGRRFEALSTATYAMSQHDEDGLQLVLTDRFFKECSVLAVSVLLNQMSGAFLGAINLFELPRERQCDVPPSVSRQRQANFFWQLHQAELPQREAARYFSANDLTFDKDLLELLYGQYVYQPGKPYQPEEFDREVFARRYREERDLQTAMNAANADTWARVIISLANAFFKDYNFMPLLSAPTTE